MKSHASPLKDRVFKGELVFLCLADERIIYPSSVVPCSVTHIFNFQNHSLIVLAHKVDSITDMPCFRLRSDHGLLELDSIQFA
jgi:hypothetical protein